MPVVHEREVLRQAGIALNGRVVTLWEISPTASAIPVLSSVLQPAPENLQLDVAATLGSWGAPIVQGSRWVGCRLADPGPWVVAPVRTRPAAPPPAGVERRCRERLVLELAGLSIGTLAAASLASAGKRLPPAEALWELARQPSVIAHEVGNPLAIALGNLDLSIEAIRDEATLDGQLRASLLSDLSNVAEGIERAADYLRLIQDRPFGDTGRFTRFDVTLVVRSCITLERPVARKQGVALKWNSNVESLFLFGESSALYQVLTNLIRNAVDASENRNGIVEITLDQEDGMLQLCVRDSGSGVAAQNLDKIFEKGFTTKPTGQGSGIGLAVVKEITESMFGGTIHVRSCLGVGSTFLLRLPIPPQRKGERG